MKLEHQVINLQQAQRLKELGVKQESLFYHIKNKVIGHEGVRMRDKLNQPKKTGVPVDGGVIQYYSAFTVAELGEMMKLIGLYSCVNTVLSGWAIHHVNGYKEYELPSGDMNNYDTEAQARGSILIHLLESKVITSEEVNTRI